MQIVNTHQAKSSLPRLVEAIEQGQSREIVIARNGRPAAKLVPLDTAQDSIDTHNDEVNPLFTSKAQLLSQFGKS